MRFLLDQGLPRTTTRELSRSNHDAVHTSEVGLATAADSEILEWAQKEDRTVVTLDADFHTILALSGATRPAVIRIRIEGLAAARVARIVETVVQKCAEEIEGGAAITVTDEAIRVRRLPILGATDAEGSG